MDQTQPEVVDPKLEISGFKPWKLVLGIGVFAIVVVVFILIA